MEVVARIPCPQSPTNLALKTIPPPILLQRFDLAALSAHSLALSLAPVLRTSVRLPVPGGVQEDPPPLRTICKSLCPAPCPLLLFPTLPLPAFPLLSHVILHVFYFPHLFPPRWAKADLSPSAVTKEHLRVWGSWWG